MTSPEKPPGFSVRSLQPRTFVVAAVAFAAAAAVVLTIATTMVVHGEEAAQQSAAATLEPDSNATDAPESDASAAEPLVVPTAIGLPRDPLSNDEVAYARSIASRDAAFIAATGADGRKPVYLSTTVSEPESYTDGGRRFELSYYSYAQAATMRFVVNLTAGAVELAESAAGVQPPPADSEVDEAYALLLASPAFEPVKQVFFAIEGTKLERADQTSYNASSFIATPGTVGAEECGIDRCVLLLIQAPDGQYLPTTGLVVNLTKQTVLEIK